jgi:hypothetical protein
MKKAATILALAIFISFAWCKAQSNPQVDDAAAVSAAKAWLTLVEDKKYGESWDEAADVFKEAIQRDNWIKAMQSVREPLGKTLNRELKFSSYRTTLPGAPKGEYIIIQFEASFENKESAIETITPALDKDGKWRVSGYFIK